MKRVSIFSLFIVLIFSACQKDETLFDQSPDERLNAALDSYERALTGAASGWKATLRNDRGDVYNFHLRFNTANRVFMYADINSESASTEKESSYRLKAMQTPSLIFDTYSYMHILADPDGSVNGGANGIGLASDFEFSLDSLVADSIMLTGRRYGTKLKLEKATQPDFDAWQNGGWLKVLSLENIGKIQNYFKRMKIGGKDYEVRVNVANKTITFIWIDANGTAQVFTTTYNYSATGIVLTTPFTTGEGEIKQIGITGWDETNLLLNVSVNGTATTIVGAPKPLAVDVNAPRRWWQQAVDAGAYWITVNGFHVNGVEDAFRIKTLNNYYYFIYWPGYDPGTNDFTGPVFINAAGTGLELQYGAAPRVPQFTSDGRAIFTLLGNYGTYPSTGPAAQTRAQLLSAQGYYFVQTGARSYDMVSASDAKAWISWTR